MREILFRGKSGDAWVEGYYINTGARTLIQRESDMTPYDVIPETVGQYIGLTDKNGKKIFEGDIVRRVTDGAIAKIINISGAVFEIDFIDDECAISDFAHYDGTDFEIIGNIHDNPELLEREV